MERTDRLLSAGALVLLTALMVCFWAPWAYERFLVPTVERTHLLYSPTLEQFIYREEIVGPIPPEARALAEDHHAGIAYRDEEGRWYSRVDFEKNLPFIYYKNLELWGMMPITLSGQTFDSASIRKERQVTELTAREVLSQEVATNLHFLIDDKPGGAGLVLPVEGLRVKASSLELVNADTNSVDQAMSEAFTDALDEAGVTWPLQGIYGNETILKPVNGGMYLIDAKGKVFNLRRLQDEPQVIETAVPLEFGARYVAVSESTRGEYLALVVGKEGGLGLIMADGSLKVLPAPGYDPETCNVKLLCDPLYRTLVVDDGVQVRALVMDREYQVLRQVTHLQSAGLDTRVKWWGRHLLPLKLDVPTDGRRATVNAQWRW